MSENTPPNQNKAKNKTKTKTKTKQQVFISRPTNRRNTAQGLFKVGPGAGPLAHTRPAVTKIPRVFVPSITNLSLIINRHAIVYPY